MQPESNYIILEEVGRGSTSVVYRAWDRNLERYVAIKSLLNADNELQKTRFFEQARFLANLSHPNIVSVYAYDPETNSMVMELLAGSLKERISVGKMKPEVASSVLKQSLEALKYLHDQKLIHGSIRPSNILIDSAGKVKLSDFALAGQDGAISAPEAALSKYVAPEIWNEASFGPIGPALDLYSLGLTLVECINGKSLDGEVPVPPGSEGGDVHWARWHTDPEHPAAIKRLVGKSLGLEKAGLLCSMLAQHAAERPKDISSLIEKLSSVRFVPVETNAVPLVPPTDPPSPPIIDPPVGPPSEPGGQPPWWPRKWDLSDTVFFRWALGAVMLSTALLYCAYQLAIGIPDRELVILAEPHFADVAIKGGEGNVKKLVLEEGKASLNLPVGQYTVTAEAEGYGNLSEDVTLGEEVTEPKSVRLELPLLNIDVDIETDPADAQIFIAEQQLTRNANGKIALKPGTYSLSIRKDGFDRGAETIFVSPSSRKFVTKPLLANGGDTIAVELKELPRPSESKPKMQAGTDSIRQSPNNSGDLKLVWCPPGNFEMGSSAGEGEENEHGRDGGTVSTTIRNGFWIAETEITQAQWTLIMSTEPWSDNDQAKRGDDYAASSISRSEAIDYCQKLNSIDKASGNLEAGQYRLPTEAEWEFACRAGTRTRFSFGDQAQRLGEYGWFDENGHNSAAFHAQRVAQMKPNPLGLFDMHGNVWEWCLDAYKPYLPGGEDPVVRSGDSPEMFVIRGGSWYGSADDARSARRGFEVGDVRTTGAMGFRVVRTLE